MARALPGALVAVVGVAGLLVLAAVVAQSAGFRLVSLATGSMSPGFPAGSVLLVRDTDAREVHPGDIVTVLRRDGRPVTHRVVAATPEGDRMRLQLHGDANAQPDPDPYLVTRVGLVIGGLPVGGQLADLARHPAALPVLAAGVSLLVLWAWWPERRRPAHRAVGGEGTA